MESGLGRWLGRHTLTGVYSTQTLDSRNENFRDSWTDPQILSMSNGGVGGTFGVAGKNIYLGPPVSPTADGFEDLTISRLDGVDHYAPGRPIEVTTWFSGVQPGTSNTRANGNSLEGSEAILALGGSDGFGNIQTKLTTPEAISIGGSLLHNKNRFLCGKSAKPFPQ